MQYKLGSLFDGSGGFPLAGSLCGVTPVWAAEVEPYPIAVTSNRFPRMKHLGDISKVNGGEIEPVDIITFGSPCQDLSVAGKRAGLKHEEKGDEETTRSGLFMEAVRIIKEMRAATNGLYPTFALWENVPGAFSSNKGEDFRTVLEELIRIPEPDAVMPPVPKAGWAYADSYRGDGWSLAYRVFDAQYWGVPQRRRRIHLVVDFRGERARKVLFEREGVRGYFAACGTPWEGTAQNVEGCLGVHDSEGERTAKHRVGGRKPGISVGGPVATLQAEGGPHAVCYAVAVTRGVEAKSWDARGNGDGETANTLTGDHENRVTDYPSVICLQGNGIDRADTAGCNGKGWKEDIPYTVATGGGKPGQSYPCVLTPASPTCFVAQNFGAYKENDRGATLKARDHKGEADNLVCAVDCRNGAETPELYPTLQAKPNGGQSLNFSGAVRVWYIVRRLTPTECARLQGFPDLWGHFEKKVSTTPEEYRFWLDVRNTHAAINGKKVKDYTPAQVLTWYNGLHKDSPEYKMWGNGIALPPALYCLQGMVDALGLEAEEDWMN